MYGKIRNSSPRLYIVISSLTEFGIAIVFQVMIIIRAFWLNYDISHLLLAVIVMIFAMITFRILLFNDLYRIAQKDQIINSTVDPDIKRQVWLKGSFEAYNLFFTAHDSLNSRFMFFYHDIIFVLLLLQILLPQ